MGSIKLKIHPLFWLFGVYYALTGKIMMFVISTTVALLHELGHSFSADRLGYRLNSVTLMPYGAVVSGEESGLKAKDEIRIAFAGPLTNLAIGVVFVLALVITFAVNRKTVADAVTGCARSLAQKRSGPLPGRFQSVDCMVSPSRDMSR